MSEKEIIAQSKEDKRKQAELELLIGDKEEKTVGNKETYDQRFNAFEDNDFAVDPTHKEYRKVVQGHNKIAKRPKKYWVLSEL